MAERGESALRVERIIVQTRTPAGTIPAVLACLFGILGIFFSGIIFVPLAALCAIIGLVRGIGSGSIVAIGLSLLALVLCFFGFLTSPSLWLLFGIGAAATLLNSNHTASVAPPSAVQNPSVYQPQPLPTFDAKQGRSLVLRLTQFDSAADNYLSKIDATKSHYQAITARMSELYQREQKLVGNPDAAVERGQLSVAVSQGELASDQYHIHVQQLESQFRSQIEQLGSAVLAFERECKRLPLSARDPISWQASCQAFHAAMKQSTAKSRNLRAGSLGLETFYVQEHSAQVDLIRQSEKIE
jgi:hypothetical protein